eukprot:jgi/Botrbrau1/22760/Bobra.0132s0091.1
MKKQSSCCPYSAQIRVEGRLRQPATARSLRLCKVTASLSGKGVYASAAIASLSLRPLARELSGYTTENVQVSGI